MAPANDLPFANNDGANGYFIVRQSQFGLPDGLVHKKTVWRNCGLVSKIDISHQCSLLPLGTSFSMAAKTISPLSSGKPVSKNSDIKLAICFTGKLSTPITCRPGNSSLV